MFDKIFKIPPKKPETPSLHDIVKSEEALQLVFKPADGESLGVFKGPRGEVRSPEISRLLGGKS